MPRKEETAAEYAARMAKKLEDGPPVARRMALTTAIMSRAQELGMSQAEYMKVLDTAQRRASREWRK